MQSRSASLRLIQADVRLWRWWKPGNALNQSWQIDHGPALKEYAQTLNQLLLEFWPWKVSTRLQDGFCTVCSGWMVLRAMQQARQSS